MSDPRNQPAVIDGRIYSCADCARILTRGDLDDGNVAYSAAFDEAAHKRCPETLSRHDGGSRSS